MLRTVCQLTMSTLMAVCFVQSVCWQCLSWWRYASYSLSADNVYPDGGMLRTVCLLTVSTLMAVRLVQFVCLQCLPWWRFASYKCREASWSVPPRQVLSGGWLSSGDQLTSWRHTKRLLVRRSHTDLKARWLALGLKDRCQVQRLRHQHETWVGLLALWTRKVLCGSFLCAIYKFSFIHSFSHFT